MVLILFRVFHPLLAAAEAAAAEHQHGAGDREQHIPRHQRWRMEGLRKKIAPFAKKPSTHRWYHPFATLERNGQLNVGITRNFVRFMFPIVRAS